MIQRIIGCPYAAAKRNSEYRNDFEDCFQHSDLRVPILYCVLQELEPAVHCAKRRSAL